VILALKRRRVNKRNMVTGTESWLWAGLGKSSGAFAFSCPFFVTFLWANKESKERI